MPETERASFIVKDALYLCTQNIRGPPPYV